MENQEEFFDMESDEENCIERSDLSSDQELDNFRDFEEVDEEGQEEKVYCMDSEKIDIKISRDQNSIQVDSIHSEYSMQEEPQVFFTPQNMLSGEEEGWDSYKEHKNSKRDSYSLSQYSLRNSDFIERQEFLQYQKITTIEKEKMHQEMEREIKKLKALTLNPVSRRLADRKGDTGVVHERLYEDHKDRELRYFSEVEKKNEEYESLLGKVVKSKNCTEHSTYLFEDANRRREKITEILKGEQQFQNELITKITKVNSRSIRILRKQIWRNLQSALGSIGLCRPGNQQEDNKTLSYEDMEKVLAESGLFPTSISSYSNLCQRLWTLLKGQDSKVSSKELCLFLMDSLAPLHIESNMPDKNWNGSVVSRGSSILSIEDLNAEEKKEIARELSELNSQARLTSKIKNATRRKDSSRNIVDISAIDNSVKIIPSEELKRVTSTLCKPTVASSVKRAPDKPERENKPECKTPELDDPVSKQHHEIEEAVQMVREKLLEMEEEGCTFKPTLFTKKKKLEKHTIKQYLEVPAYERLFGDSQARRMKKEVLLTEGLAKTQEELELEKCTFQPKFFAKQKPKATNKGVEHHPTIAACSSDHDTMIISSLPEKGGFQKRASEAFEKRVASLRSSRKNRLHLKEMLASVHERTNYQESVPNINPNLNNVKPFELKSDKRAAKRLDDLSKKKAEIEEKEKQRMKEKTEQHRAFKASCIRSAVKADIEKQLSQRDTEPLILLEVAVPGKAKVEILPIWKEDDPVQTSNAFCSKFCLPPNSSKMLECKVRLLFARSLLAEIHNLSMS